MWQNTIHNFGAFLNTKEPRGFYRLGACWVASIYQGTTCDGMESLPQAILNNKFIEWEMVGCVGMWTPTKDEVGVDIPSGHVHHGSMW